MYQRNRALPANIKTRDGNNYKAILITENYGVLFSEDTYIKNRGRYLLKQKAEIEAQNDAVIRELQDLNVYERMRLYETREEEQ
jgi:hypothetical protein